MNPTPKKIKWIYIIIPSACVLLLFILFMLLPLTLPKNAIASNVYAQNMNLSKMTKSDAVAKLEHSYVQKKEDFSVVFEHDGKNHTANFSSDDIQFTVDPQKTAEAAYQFGRSSNTFKNSWNILCSFFKKANVGMIPSCNKELITPIFYELGAEVYGHSQDAEYRIENGILTVIPPTSGQSHNVDDAIKEFLSAAGDGEYKNIKIHLYKTKIEKLDVDDVYKKVVREPKNAEYKVEGNEVSVTEHVVGVEADKSQLAALLEQTNKGEIASMEITEIMPEQTTEALQAALFATTLATFTSNYSSSSANRAYNVELAAQKINGIVLADGDEFSYNKAVGNANAANGFKMATVFSNGKVVEGIGGGVCQVSSTLYCSVLRSDLFVTERHNHSLPIGYVPGGQDATVSYGSLDFKFKNNTGTPIKIVAQCSNRNVTISILGNASAKKNVEVTSQKISSVEAPMTKVNDPNLPSGTTKVIKKGSPGSVYITYKKVYDANGALTSEKQIKSTYKASAGEIAVGTGAVTAPSAPASEPAQPEMPAPEQQAPVPETPQTEAPVQEQPTE